MDLLERDAELAALDTAYDAAIRGRGRIALVSGEAGMGKTSLVRAFLDRHSEARVLRGLCDDLSAPRALGPLLDMVGDVGAELAATLTGESASDRLYGLVLAELNRPPRPVVLVIEDLHWADIATLDLVTYLVRRIDTTGALVVLSYRSDELDPGQPLLRALTRVPPHAAVRVELEPLSIEAIRRVVGDEAEALHALTGGNPFYLSEVLASPGRVPQSVADAVLSRVGRLPEMSQRLLELVALSPGRIDRALLDACSPGWLVAAVELELRGMLDIGPSSVSFRHEIARRAVAEQVPTGRAAGMNRALLDALVEQGSDPARIVHHALAIGDEDAVAEHALAAARQAARYNAHREALGQFRRVGPRADRLEPSERAEFYEQWSSTCVNTADMDEAIELAQRAMELRRELGDIAGVSRVARFLAHTLWAMGEPDAADRYLAEAVSVAAELPPGHDVADTLATRALRAMVKWESEDAIRWARQAVALAEESGDDDVRAIGLITIGSAEYGIGRGGLATAERGIELARSRGFHDVACIGYANLAETAVEHRHYEDAVRYLDLGSTWADEHEVLSVLGYLTGVRARLEFERGHWNEAGALASSLLTGSGSTPLNDLNAMYAMAGMAIRTGAEDATVAVNRYVSAAEQTGERQRLVPAAILRAEAAELAGALESERTALRGVYDVISDTGELAALGELGRWLARAGIRVDVPSSVLAPARAEMAGDWRAAAEGWAQLGCPYEQADALVHSGDSGGLLEALPILDGLGAGAAAGRARELLRRHGVRQIPRGPRATTRANPAGLTDRQVDVLALVARGMTNAEIADELVVSVRTVDHHVAAILTKLEVSSRRQAAELARQLGLGQAEPQPR